MRKRLVKAEVWEHRCKRCGKVLISIYENQIDQMIRQHKAKCYPEGEK